MVQAARHLAPAAATALILAACSAGPTMAPETTRPSTPASAAGSSTTLAGSSTTSTTSSRPAPAPSPSSARTSPPAPSAPRAFRTTVVHHGADHPDDLALDASGALLYSDYTNGTISRLAPNGTVTVLHRGLAGPEGLVPLADGTLIVAEEKTNRILSIAPGATTPRVLRVLPGTPTLVTCHQGVDGIAWDATTSTVIVPDAVTGTIYRMSTDGASLTRLAGGFVHPVGAAVDEQGRVYVADECGGDVWRLGSGGSRTRVARASMPDDVALDGHGNLIVTDVRHVNHDVRRWSLTTGRSTVLARAGLVEPQGLLVEPSGRIWIADDRADLILLLTPVP